MSSTKMIDYFKTIKKREVQLSSKSQLLIGAQATANKKLCGPASDSLTVGKQPSNTKNAAVKKLEKITVGLDGASQEKALTKKRKLSTDDVVIIPKQTKLEKSDVVVRPTVAPAVTMPEVITNKNIGKSLKKPGNAEKIAQMRESLQKINNISDKLKQIIKPTSESLKPTVPVSAGEKVPAFQRHHSLASKDAVKLVLPFKYKVLADMFKCLDSVVSIMHNRHEICDFKKLKPALQLQLGRTFNLSHLGQIAAVFPNGFIFKQEKVHSYEVDGKVFNYQLTVYPNFDCFTNDPTGAMQKCDNDTKDTVPRQPFRSMTPNFLVSRQQYFFDSLLSTVKKQHKEFLSTLSPPIKLSSEKLIKWHPQFKLDEAVDIAPAPLPEPENVRIYTTAKDVLANVRGLFSSQIDNALETVANKAKDCQLQEPITLPKPAKPSAVKGIPLALLEKIRAKEVAQIKANITRNPANELKLARLAQLPEVSRIVRNLFIAEKRAAIPYSQAVTKVVESALGSVSPSEMGHNVALLVELLPEWLQVIEIRNSKFLKINKLVNFNDVIAKLENERKTILQSR